MLNEFKFKRKWIKKIRSGGKNLEQLKKIA
jgi:hypothetical protein